MCTQALLDLSVAVNRVAVCSTKVWFLVLRPTWLRAVVTVVTVVRRLDPDSSSAAVRRDEQRGNSRLISRIDDDDGVVSTPTSPFFLPRGPLGEPCVTRLHLVARAGVGMIEHGYRHA